MPPDEAISDGGRPLCIAEFLNRTRFFLQLEEVAMSRVVYLATDEELSNPVYLLRLWLAARNMPYSRREWLDKLCSGIYDFDGEIRDKYDLPWHIPDDYIDSVMGDSRWISYFFGSSRISVGVTERFQAVPARNWR
jgi:hypothetical protein